MSALTEYKKARKNLLSAITSMKRRGYIIEDDYVPKIPKQIKAGSVRALEKKQRELYDKALYINRETGELVSGKVGRNIERRAAAVKGTETRTRTKATTALKKGDYNKQIEALKSRLVQSQKTTKATASKISQRQLKQRLSEEAKLKTAIAIYEDTERIASRKEIDSLYDKIITYNKFNKKDKTLNDLTRERDMIEEYINKRIDYYHRYTPKGDDYSIEDSLLNFREALNELDEQIEEAEKYELTDYTLPEDDYYDEDELPLAELPDFEDYKSIKSKLPDKNKTAYDNLVEKIRSWSPDGNWTESLTGAKENDKSRLEGILNGAVSRDGIDAVMTRLDEHAALVDLLSESVLYDSGTEEGNFTDGRTAVNAKLVWLGEIINGAPLSADELEKLTYAQEGNEEY